MYYNSSSVIYENMSHNKYKVLQTQKIGFKTIITKKLIEISQTFTKNGKQHTELNMKLWKTENMFCCKNML